MDWWQWLKAKTAPTLFRVLPVDPAVERDELLARIRRDLYGHAWRGERLTKAAARDLIDLIDHYQEGQPPRLHRHPVTLSPSLDYGRQIDTTRPPCSLKIASRRMF